MESQDLEIRELDSQNSETFKIWPAKMLKIQDLEIQDLGIQNLEIQEIQVYLQTGYSDSLRSELERIKTKLSKIASDKNAWHHYTQQGAMA